MLMHFALFDVDNFKQLNDQCGHIYGDEVLCWMSGAFQELLGETGFAARTGGDEFGVLLSGDEPELLLTQAIEDVRAAAAEDARPGAPEVSISAGLVTVLPGVDVSLDEAYQAADKALYEAKEGKSSGPSMIRITRKTLTCSTRGTGGARNPGQ